METIDTHDEIKELLLENQRLLKENNELLLGMRRSARWAFAFRVLWFAMILGAPIALYYLLLEPNIDSLYRAYGVFERSATELTGLRQFLNESGTE